MVIDRKALSLSDHSKGYRIWCRRIWLSKCIRSATHFLKTMRTIRGKESDLWLITVRSNSNFLVVLKYGWVRAMIASKHSSERKHSTNQAGKCPPSNPQEISSVKDGPLELRSPSGSVGRFKPSWMWFTVLVFTKSRKNTESSLRTTVFFLKRHLITARN